MLAEAANGAAAEWDAEHHRGEHVGSKAGMAGRAGPRGSSSTALDALGDSPGMDFPMGLSPEQDRASLQQSPRQEQVLPLISITSQLLPRTAALELRQYPCR